MNAEQTHKNHHESRIAYVVESILPSRDDQSNRLTNARRVAVLYQRCGGRFHWR